jgi:hypothetical protein
VPGLGDVIELRVDDSLAVVSKLNLALLDPLGQILLSFLSILEVVNNDVTWVSAECMRQSIVRANSPSMFNRFAMTSNQLESFVGSVSLYSDFSDYP